MICEKCHQETFVIHVTREHEKICDKCFNLIRFLEHKYGWIGYLAPNIDFTIVSKI